MIRLSREKYQDKVKACWIGKNIGGTMGAPYEAVRHTLDIQGFSTPAGKAMPNDDLDLQLVWLHVAEKLGAKINAQILGEFWLNFIPPNWNEYGIAKNNMRRGLLPSIAGDYENEWKNSNGAWIRTEIWACLTPACPAATAKYAIEDGKVDHGVGEGTYAAAFVGAMQSAAFVVSDIRKCIEIGLCAIPNDSRVAKSIVKILECYDSKIPARQTRDIIFEMNKDIGSGWFEAPSNVSYAIIGLIYGEGDFKKSMITAINCGDDTDCTAATVGATLGILGGTDILPKDWCQHIGDDIVTISIDRSCAGYDLPTTCTELTERVVKKAPHILAECTTEVEISSEETIPENLVESFMEQIKSANLLDSLKPYSTHFDFAFAGVDMQVEGGPEITALGEKKIHLTFENKYLIYHSKCYNLSFRWWLPEGFSVEGKKSLILDNFNGIHSKYLAKSSIDFTIKAGETIQADNKCVLEVTAQGYYTPMYIPILLLS